MAADILSQDFLAICLLLAEGDTTHTLDRIASAAEKFQEEKDRHFGVFRSDFRVMLLLLILDEQSLALDPDTVTLGEIIPPMLRHHDVYSNDSDTCWAHEGGEVAEDDYEFLAIERWYGLSREEYRQKQALKQAMKELFAGEPRPGPEQVRQFLASHDLDERLLHHCSRPGASS
jgi:hypothetical protein